MFTSVLVPVDDSPQSQTAAGLGIALAHKLAAKLTLVHVLHEPPMHPLQSQSITMTDVRNIAKNLLQPLLARAEHLGLSCETVLPNEDKGGIGATIVNLADERGCDFILMSTHGREGLGRVLLGSVAERVARLAKQPVMLVRQAKNVQEKNLQVATTPFTRLLVPVDGGEASTNAIELACDLAKRFEAELNFVYVIPNLPIPLSEPMGAYAAIDYAALEKTFEETGRVALVAALEKANGLKATSNVLRAGFESIATAIVHAATECQANLIVMGTHGRTGVNHLLLGSVAEAVTHHADVPVLLVRPNLPFKPNKQQLTEKGVVPM